MYQLKPQKCFALTKKGCDNEQNIPVILKKKKSMHISDFKKWHWYKMIPSYVCETCAHPAHHMFDLLPSGRCYRSIRTRTNRLRNSIFPQAITALNTNGHWHTHTRVRMHTHMPRTMCNNCKTLYIFIYLFLILTLCCLVLFTCTFYSILCCVYTWMLLEFHCTLCNDNKRILILKSDHL